MQASWLGRVVKIDEPIRRTTHMNVVSLGERGASNPPVCGAESPELPIEAAAVMRPPRVGRRLSAATASAANDGTRSSRPGASWSRNRQVGGDHGGDFRISARRLPIGHQKNRLSDRHLQNRSVSRRKECRPDHGAGWPSRR